MEDPFLNRLERQRKKLKDRKEQQRLRIFIRRILFCIFLGITIVVTSTIVYNYSFSKEKVLLNNQIIKEMNHTETRLTEILSALIAKQMIATEERLKGHMQILIKQEMKITEDKFKDYIVFRIKNDFANLKVDDKIQYIIQTQIKDKIRPMINAELQISKEGIANLQNKYFIIDKDLRKLKEDYEILRNTLSLNKLIGH